MAMAPLDVEESLLAEPNSCSVYVNGNKVVSTKLIFLSCASFFKIYFGGINLKEVLI